MTTPDPNCGFTTDSCCADTGPILDHLAAVDTVALVSGTACLENVRSVLCACLCRHWDAGVLWGSNQSGVVPMECFLEEQTVAGLYESCTCKTSNLRGLLEARTLWPTSSDLLRSISGLFAVRSGMVSNLTVLPGFNPQTIGQLGVTIALKETNCSE